MIYRINSEVYHDQNRHYPQKKVFLWGWVNFFKETPLGKKIPIWFTTKEGAETWLSKQGQK